MNGILQKNYSENNVIEDGCLKNDISDDNILSIVFKFAYRELRFRKYMKRICPI